MDEAALGRKFRRLCWPCLAIVWGLYLVATAAMAADGSGEGGPGWRDLALGAIGLVSMLAGAHGTRIERQNQLLAERQDRAEGRIQGISETMAAQAVRDEHAEKALLRLEQSQSALHRRLDYMRIPHVPGQPDSGG